MTFSITFYNTLFDACARNNEMRRIPKLLEELHNQKIEPNVISYIAIIRGYCTERRLDKAFEMLEDMKRLKNLTPDEGTYNTLINACACQGLYDRGFSVLADMESAGVAPSNFTLSVLVKLCGRARKHKEAFEMCERLADKYKLRLNIYVYNNLIMVCINARNALRAMEVFSRLLEEGVSPDVWTYTLLLRGLAGPACRAADRAAGLLRLATGLPGAPDNLIRAAGARLVQPDGGLPADLVTEVLDGLVKECGNETLASELLTELRGLRAYARVRLSSRRH